MKTALLLLFGLACLGQGLGTRTPSAHNVQRRSSNSTEDAAVFLLLGVDAPDPWSLSVGDTVQIRCVMVSFDKERTKHLKPHLSKVQEESAIQTLTTEPTSYGISYTISSVTLRDRGLYSCNAYNTDPHITVEEAHKLIWVNDASPAVSLELLRVNRVKYFYDQTFTIGCQLPNDDSQWRIFRASEKPGRMVYEECPNQEQSGRLVTCTIPHLPFPVSSSRRYDPFWCESSSELKSNVLNMTEREFTARDSRDLVVIKYELTAPWFVREGDSVGFLCNVRYDKNNNKDKFDLQLIWTKQDPENNMTVLLSQKASTLINYTLTDIKHEHSGVYSCFDDGTLSNIEVSAKHFFIWVEDDSPPVTIDVLSHNRTQFFYKEKFTVGCQLPNDQSQWKLKSYDDHTGVIKECEKPELSPSRLLSCTTILVWSDYLFWCESTTGLKSNVLNMTSALFWHVLEAPPLGVMEGDDLTLRCLKKNRTTGIIFPARAHFEFNEYIFGLSDVGSYTIKNVTKANEGFYSCRMDRSATLNTYITVKAGPTHPKPQCKHHRERVLGSSPGGLPAPGAFIPQCDEHGQYSSRQCHASTGHCWCVDSAGQEKPGTRSSPGSPRVDCDRPDRPKTHCEHRRDGVQSPGGRPALGAFVPQCDESGQYAPRQCHGSTGHCWCVDSSGQERAGSRTGPGTPRVDC